MIITTLSVIGIAAGVDQMLKRNLKLGLWSVAVCSTAFLVNLL